MGRLIKGILLTFIVSFFLFPAEFTFLPSLYNSKNLLAVFGVIVFVIDSLQNRGIRISNRVLISAFLAVVFSLWCLYSITTNGTDDTTYSSYWSAFLLWVSAGYAVYFLLRISYGRVDLPLVTKYLAIVGVAQCAIALMIDYIEPVKRVVDAVFVGGEYFSLNFRLYGIGCALDPAGCRFSVIQVMIAHQIVNNKEVRDSGKSLIRYLLAFIIVVVVGSMISRTTLVGSSLGLVYIILSVIRLKQGGFISKDQFRLFLIFFLLILFAIGLIIGFYRINTAFRNYLRFGFEAFFNWVETGEFHTSSTDTLIRVMWIWPNNPHTWIVGSGRIGVYEWGTDIGYCNFVLYCGLIGLVLYSVYFIFNHLSLNGKFQHFHLTSILLIALTFIIWAKVTTDIFFIDALLFCIDGDKQNE